MSVISVTGPGGGGASSIPFEAATQFWVDENAPAGGNGSAIRPFQTLSEAVAAIDASAETSFVVRLAPGAYVYDAGAEATIPTDGSKLVFLEGVLGAVTVALEGYNNVRYDPSPDLYTYETELYLCGASEVKFAINELPEPPVQDPVSEGNAARFYITLDPSETPVLSHCAMAYTVVDESDFAVLGVTVDIRTASASPVVLADVVAMDGTGMGAKRLTITRANVHGGKFGAISMASGSFSGHAETDGATTITGRAVSGTVINASSQNTRIQCADIVGLSILSDGLIQIQSIERIAGLTAISEASGVNLEFASSADEIYIRGLVIRAAGPSGRGMIESNNDGGSGAFNALIRDADIVYTGLYDEPSVPGTVAIIQWFNTEGTLTLDNVSIETTTIGIMHSHVSVDPGRDSKVQNLIVRNSRIKCVMNAEDGPDDNPACIVSRAAAGSTILVENSVLELDCSALTDVTNARGIQGTISVSTSHTTGALNLITRNVRTIMTGTSGAASRGAYVTGGGSGSGTLNVDIYDPAFETSAVDHTIRNGGGTWTIYGLISSESDFTSQNSVTLDGLTRSASMQSVGTKWIDVTPYTMGTTAWTMDDGGAFETTTSGAHIFFGLPFAPGTIVTGIRAKYLGVDSKDGIDMRLLKRDESAVSEAWTVVGTLQSSSVDEETAVLSYTLPDAEIIAADTHYRIEIGAVIDSVGSRLFAVAAQISERHL